jgi:hypothetical protein
MTRFFVLMMWTSPSQLHSTVVGLYNDFAKMKEFVGERIHQEDYFYYEVDRMNSTSLTYKTF